MDLISIECTESPEDTGLETEIKVKYDTFFKVDGVLYMESGLTQLVLHTANFTNNIDAWIQDARQTAYRWAKTGELYCEYFDTENGKDLYYCVRRVDFFPVKCIEYKKRYEEVIYLCDG